MTLLTEATTPAVRARPATVTVAWWLQIGAVAALLTMCVLTVVQAIQFDGLIDRAAELTDADPDEVSAERAWNVQGTVMAGVPALLILLGLAATLLPIRRGSNVGRILACVASGLQFLCCFGALGLGAVVALPFLFLASGEPEFTEEDAFLTEESAFYEKLYELDSAAVTSWLSGTAMLVGMLAFMLTTTVGVLLLVPPSNRYFRSEPDRPAPWPHPMYAYPAYPPSYPMYPPPHYWQPPPPPASPPSSASPPPSADSPDPHGPAA